jgi:hypothetical protein
MPAVPALRRSRPACITYIVSLKPDRLHSETLSQKAQKINETKPKNHRNQSVGTSQWLKLEQCKEQNK